MYAFLNDRIYVELYPIKDKNDSLSGSMSSSSMEEKIIDLLDPNNKGDDEISLNEWLVKKKFAEPKLETDVCQQMNFRRNTNNYHEVSSKDTGLHEEFPLVFDDDELNPIEYQFGVSIIVLFILFLHLVLSLDQRITRQHRPAIYA